MFIGPRPAVTAADIFGWNRTSTPSSPILATAARNGETDTTALWDAPAVVLAWTSSARACGGHAEIAITSAASLIRIVNPPLAAERYSTLATAINSLRVERSPRHAIPHGRTDT